MWASATTYNTSTTLATTSCTAVVVNGGCDATKDYAWASQSVTGSITIYVVSSGNTNASGNLNADAYVRYSTNGGSTYTQIYDYYDVSWRSDTKSASSSSVSNLSTVVVELEVSVTTTTTVGTRDIIPSSIYIVATAGGGNHLIWWITSNGQRRMFDLGSPWHTGAKEYCEKLAGQGEHHGIPT